MTLGTLWHFFTHYYEGFAIIILVLGLYFLTVGGRYYKETMFLFGEMTFTAASMIILFSLVLPKNAPEYVVWLTLISALGFGCGAGYLVQRYARAGVLLIGFWLGGLFGAFFYASIVSRFQNENTLMSLWLTIVLCSIGVAILS